MADTSDSPLWANLFRAKPSLKARIAALWAATPLFDGVPRREIRRLAEHMHPRRYGAGEAVFHAGDLGVAAALVVSGRVEIRMGGATLTTLGPGDFFGEVALVSEQSRTADAVAMEETELVFFLRLDLEEWLARKPRVGAQLLANLARVLAERLRFANRRLQELQVADSPEAPRQPVAGTGP